MGMYTEIIFGAELKQETPEQVINALKYMIGDIEDKPNDFPLSIDQDLFKTSSYYFGVNKPVAKMWFDDISKTWRMNARSNIKNYEREIETFLEWIKPYIKSGSGIRNMFAMVMYEEDYKPTIYYLNDRSFEEDYGPLSYFKNKKEQYIAVVNPKDFGIIFPDFLGCVSVGDNIDDAMIIALEVLELHIQGMREDGEELPNPKSLEEVKKEYPNQIYLIIDIC